MKKHEPIPNEMLKAARLEKCWTLAVAAEQTNVSIEAYSRWEYGIQEPRLSSLQLLCEAFEKLPAELGFGHRIKKSHPQEKQAPSDDKASQTSLVTLTSEQVTMLSSLLQGDNHMLFDDTRREALKKILAATGIASTLPALLFAGNSSKENKQLQEWDISEKTIELMAIQTAHFRNLQRSGANLREMDLRKHIKMLQQALENTLDDKLRRELWRTLALTQLILRHYAMEQNQISQAKTWNEDAISSAQRSGDTILIGGTFGHLAHLYLMKQNDSSTAYQLLETAEQQSHHAALRGWLSILKAAVASKEENERGYEYALAKATDLAMTMPRKQDYIDIAFTDFDRVSVDAWSGNCFIDVHKPEKAIKQLMEINLQELAENRHAAHYRDIAHVHMVTGDFANAQQYAFQAIDTAVTTNNIEIIPTCLKIAQDIQNEHTHNSYATAIIDYARVALEQAR